MRILVADDDPVTLRLILAILEAEGHEVLTAASGEAALERFLAHRVELVLTDFQMPGMSGAELCREIRARCEGRFVPIVVITGGEDRAGMLRESLAAGAIEFLPKPLCPEELRTRIRALEELANLHADVVAQKEMWEEEASVFKHIMDRYVEEGRRLMPPGFAMETLRTARINGDICVYRQGLPGIHCGMIVDATGHGLAAAISTIPVVESFLSMVAKDIPLARVYAEVNGKLRRMLPTDRFACLLMWRVDTFQETLTVLNAGMPPAFLIPRDGGLRAFPSRHLPAGVAEFDEEIVAEEVSVALGDRFFAASDGFLEILPAEELPALLEGAFREPVEDHAVRVAEAVARCVADAEQHDDISWALWEIPPATFGRSEDEGKESDPLTLVQGLCVSFRVDPRVLGFRELVPNLLGLLSSLGVRQSDTQVLALLIFEAVSNALEHGLLRLDSSLKENSFDAFDLQRRERLAALEAGRIEVVLALFHEPAPSRAIRRIHVAVDDSGPGFDWRTFLAERDLDPSKPHGRGIALIQAMARDVAYNEAGNRIHFWLPCL